MNNHFIITARENIVNANCVYRTFDSLLLLLYLCRFFFRQFKFIDLIWKKIRSDLVPCCNWIAFRNTYHVKRCNLKHTHSTYRSRMKNCLNCKFQSIFLWLLHLSRDWKPWNPIFFARELVCSLLLATWEKEYISAFVWLLLLPYDDENNYVIGQ